MRALKYSQHILIIGSRSNLSRTIALLYSNVTLLSSSSLESLPLILKHHNKSIIVYNTSYKSNLLSDTASPRSFIDYSIGYLGFFAEICQIYSKYIDKVLFTSSSSIYGDTKNLSEGSFCYTGSLYSTLKYSSELFLKAFLKPSQIPLIIARPFNIYDGYDDFSMINRIDQSIHLKHTLTLLNHGRSIRDYISVYDVAKIYLLLVFSDFTGIVNIGTGIGTSTSQLLDMYKKYHNISFDLQHVDRPEIEYSVADIALLKSLIGNFQFKNLESFIASKQFSAS